MAAVGRTGGAVDNDICEPDWDVITQSIIEFAATVVDPDNEEWSCAEDAQLFGLELFYNVSSGK